MYKKRSGCRSKVKKAIHEGKRLRRENGIPPDYPIELPEVRRKIVVTDYDFGEVTHVFDCLKTNRRDCYRVLIDGNLWKEKVGWSNILAIIRKGFPRVGAM